MSQTWRCPRCGEQTYVPIRASGVTCCKGHEMQLIEQDGVAVRQPATTKGRSK